MLALGALCFEADKQAAQPVFALFILFALKAGVCLIWCSSGVFWCVGVAGGVGGVGGVCKLKNSKIF